MRPGQTRLDLAQIITEGEGATHCGIATAIARICQAITHDSDLVPAAGLVHPDVEGIADVRVPLPVDRGGCAGPRRRHIPALGAAHLPSAAAWFTRN